MIPEAEQAQANQKKSLSSLIDFDPISHKYTRDGIVIPSVTQVIDPLVSFYAPAEVLEAARIRGSIVHSLTEGIDMGLMAVQDAYDDAEKCDLLGYVKAWEKFKQDTGAYPFVIEERVFSLLYGYAGTLDRICKFVTSSDIWLVDIKTGILMPEHALQTAAYEQAYREANPLPKITHRMCVQLKSDGTYTTKTHKSKTDLGAFLAALTLRTWREQNG